MANNLSQGTRQLPLRHISIRVPWNDTGWSGVVCKNQIENSSCLILPRIRSNRDDTKEVSMAGKSWEDLTQDNLPPCMSEHGQFMAPYEITRKLVHPYAENSKAHKHLLSTPFEEGGGPNGILITTSDYHDGGIDVTGIIRWIEIIKKG